MELIQQYLSQRQSETRIDSTVLVCIQILISIFGGLLTALLPWGQLSASGMPDLQRNIARFSGQTPIPTFDGVTSFILEEQLWPIIMGKIIGITGSAVLAFTILTLCTATIALFTFLRWGGHWSGASLLASPLFIDFHYSQSRLALAVTILAVALLLAPLVHKHLRIPLAITTVLLSLSVHTASSIVILAYLFVSSANNKWKLTTRYRAFIMVVGSVSIFLLLTVLRAPILSLWDDRRVNYLAASSSIEFASIWAVLAIVLVIYAGKSRESKSIAILAGIFGMTFFLVTLSNTYGSRLVALSLPAQGAAISQLSGPEAYMVIAVLVSYVSIHWFLWLA